MDSIVIYTLGHSNRGAREFTELLHTHDIGKLLDIRRYPSSRRFPHFNGPELAKHLAVADIEYVHYEVFGGRRKGIPGSRNTALNDEGFRGYADYMATSEFQRALQNLLEHAANCRCALMCAEALPEHCHRNLLADALESLGCEVRHIVDERNVRTHVPSSFAKTIVPGLVHYPAPQQELEF